MNCERMDDIVDGHGFDRSSAAERTAIAAHLERCPRCAAIWLSYQTLAAETPPGPHPDLLPAVVRRAVQAQTAARPVSSRPWAAAAGIAALGVLTLLAILGTRSGPEEPATATALEPAPVASRFVAGQHYMSVGPAGAAQAAAAPDVIEFFMWGCYPCYSFEPAFAYWSRQLPADVRFERVPVLFNARAWLHAQAFYTAVELGKVDELHAAAFEEIHQRRNTLDSEAEIAALFARFGVDGKTFARTFSSPAVRSALERAVALNRAFSISATPTIVVNGRYLTTPVLAGEAAAMLAVADELLARSRCAGRNACPGLF